MIRGEWGLSTGCAGLALCSFIMGMGGKMPRRKQARRTNVKDMRSIPRLPYGQELSVRAVSERLKLGTPTVSTYVLRAREARLGACQFRRHVAMNERGVVGEGKREAKR